MSIDEMVTSITEDIQVASKKICGKLKSKKETKLLEETNQIIQERRETSRDLPNCSTINRKVKQRMRRDIKAYKT